MGRRRASTALTHWFTWRHLRCKVVENPSSLGYRNTLLELHVIAPRDTPVPITTTGFLAHFMTTAELREAGGSVAFFTTWMDREAASKDYRRAEFLWRQGDLFHQLALDEDRDA